MEEEFIVLVRFPQFDFFRNTHVCEDGDGQFDPKLLEFDRATVGSQHPILVLNKGRTNEQRFIGHWDEGISGHTGFNRVVVSLDTAPNSLPDDKMPSLVPSLFLHSQEGLTSDDARVKKAKALQHSRLSGVRIPSRVLVAHPITS